MEDGSTLHPAGVREFYRIIVEQSDRMCGLISNTLDLARIETGTLPMDPSAAKVADLVEEARNGCLSR